MPQTYAGAFNYGGLNLPVGNALFGTCATAANVQQKDVTLAVFDDFLTGITIHVKFTNSNTASNPTLKVANTAAKSIMCYGTTAPGTSSKTSWNAGAVVSFTYDGTYWIMNDWLNDGGDISGKADVPVKKSITLGTTWSGSGPYTQTVTVSGYTVTANTRVDLTADSTVLAQLKTDGVEQVYISNDSGTLTAVATGAAPTVSLTVNAILSEVT